MGTAGVNIAGFEKRPLTISCNFFIPPPGKGQENCEIVLFFESEEDISTFTSEAKGRDIYDRYKTTIADATFEERNVGDTAFEC
jgi:hypothetical protein